MMLLLMHVPFPSEPVGPRACSLLLFFEAFFRLEITQGDQCLKGTIGRQKAHTSTSLPIIVEL
jgi:hypothetical protein